MVYIFFCCIVMKILNLKDPVLIRILLANALKSIGYTDTELFLSIGKLDGYQHESLGKWQQIFIQVLKSQKE
jgi:hypothetical protein